ncbi:MAG TPA: NPCBM/NEW2 domain-containing protein [Candidatus Baltobacteraceae bacterium]|jgi:alpha-galactosidase|nr:NPCBM/NEW2 domain-containing protein [Candidatus Baltobacteraceae bacterium]
MKALFTGPGIGSYISVMTLTATLASAETIRLDQLDITRTQQDWGDPHRNQSVDGHPLSIGPRIFEHGVGTHATSSLYVTVNGAQKFSGSVGVDGEVTSTEASVDFFLFGDGKELWHSGVMKAGDAPKTFQVDLTGVKMLALKVGDAGDGINYDHADWADAQFEYSGTAPSTESGPREEAVILTPIAPAAPRINGTSVVGARPGHPFFYHVPVTGSRPMTLGAAPLPDGLVFDSERGLITGAVATPGKYSVMLAATNTEGSASRQLEIDIGDTIALTPPLGWNSWNCFAQAVDDGKIRAAADAMVRSGLIDHGWTYINIDDCWEGKRDANGMIQPNEKFPDMKALADYVHSKGLKIGLYSSPGPKTCGGYEGSWQHENQDAQQYAAWGFDYLKYDWCSYSEVDDKSLPDRQRLMKPYLAMDAALHKLDRDILFSLCQYGMGDVWEWGTEVGGNCWRTTGDISDSWSSMSRIGFSQNGHEKYAGPGHWNDPDMLVVGKVGWGNLHPTHLTPNEQYTHVSLWCLLSAPLLIGADMSQLDAFTFNLLSNDEVLAVSQDALGKQAARMAKNGETEVWAKKMADGSLAVGLFNRGEMPVEVNATWEDLGLTGKHRVRDLWRQQDAGEFENVFSTSVPRHGVCLVRVW